MNHSTSFSSNISNFNRNSSFISNNKLFVSFSNSLFQGRQIDPKTFHSASVQFKQMLKENGLDFIIWFFFETLLMKGAIIYRQRIIDNSTEKTIIDQISVIWISFYTYVIPTLSFFLQPLGHQIVSNFNEASLLRFRDSIVLHLKFDLEKSVCENLEVSNAFKQMLQTIIRVHDHPFPTATFLKFEKIVSTFIRPYIGYQVFLDNDFNIKKNYENDQSLVDDVKSNEKMKKMAFKNLKSYSIQNEIRPRSAIILQKNN